MLTYRLDKDVALVLVSAWSSLGTDRPVATIEHMQKVRESEKDSLLLALTVEWKAALTDGIPKHTTISSPQQAEYWERPAKLRRIQSEAKSPTK